MLNDFITYLKIHDYSNRTIDMHIYELKRLFKEVDINNITQEDINNYIVKYKESHQKSTTNIMIHSLKIYFRFKKLNIEMPKLYRVKQKLPDYIDFKYFNKIILPAIPVISKTPNRDIVVLSFLLYTGLRRGEMLLLKRKNFNLKERTVKIFMPKTNMERVIYLPKKIIPLIKYYFKNVEEKENAFNLTKNTVNVIFRKIRPYFIPEVTLYPHLFRHSYAVRLLQKTNLSVVQQALGHRNISSTVRYTTLKKEDLKKSIDKAF